jgi:hypothetical protein
MVQETLWVLDKKIYPRLAEKILAKSSLFQFRKNDFGFLLN